MAGPGPPAGLLGAGVRLLATCARRERLEALCFFSAVCPAREESSRSRGGANSPGYLARDRGVELPTRDISHDEGAQDILFAAVDTYRTSLQESGVCRYPS